jgi:hypothetical protein
MKNPGDQNVVAVLTDFLPRAARPRELASMQRFLSTERSSEVPDSPQIARMSRRPLFETEAGGSRRLRA